MLVFATLLICDQHSVHLGNSIVMFFFLLWLRIITSFINFRMTVVLLPILTFAIYLPSLFRYEVVKCVLTADGSITYYKRDNSEFLQTLFYSVSKWKAFNIFWHFSSSFFTSMSTNVSSVDKWQKALNLMNLTVFSYILLLFAFLFLSSLAGLQSNIGNSI